MGSLPRNLIIGVAVILTLVSCFLSIGSSQQAAKIREGLDKERYYRMEVEEKLEHANGTIASLQSQLDSAAAKIKSIQTLVSEGQSAQTDLQAQLDSVSQLKASLEKKLNEVQQLNAAAVAAQSAATESVAAPAVVTDTQ